MNRYTYSPEVRAALEGLRQPLAIYQLVDHQIVTLLVSDGFCQLFGYADREQAVWDMDHDMYKDTHPDDRKRISEAALRFAAGGDEYEVVFRTRAGVDADYRVIHAHGKHVYTQDGIRLAHVWYMDEGMYIEGDESAGTQMNRELNSILHEESIMRAANYDALTGLPNLGYFFKLCETKKARITAEGKRGCLLYIDLNGMKYYNHKNGFAEGDKLLKAFAKCLAESFGREDCCHVGADRFAVAAADDALKDRLGRFFDEVERLDNHLPVRVGVYTTGIEDVPVSMAYDRAKVACDSIPKAESSCFHYYTRDLSDRDRRSHYIQANIDRAIAEKWIKVYYQPIIRAVNGKVCEEEALARWIDPTEGFLSPADFIPVLEQTGLIYKLDLFVLEQVLEKMAKQTAAGLSVVPHSINLSRADFDACDIVEEIRKRVDAAGVGRNRITIEITESVIGSDFEYMKGQVERFQALGFPVWMDDFGSGYSSLDLLQSIRFDLIKFDMSFMRKLDEGVSGKIILTELMKMATSLGVDTICEGVETESQMRFLQDIGCSKLQGFYFCKPIPFDEIVERNREGIQIGYENPKESGYFEAIGRVNLYDLDVIANVEDGAFQNAFNTLPMGILEIEGARGKYVRCNQSYRDFVRNFFKFDAANDEIDFDAPKLENAAVFLRTVKQCCESGIRTFFDEKMPDGTIVHQFIRRIGKSPVTGNTAAAIAVLSISEPGEGATYADIARALAADYYNIYVVDLDTDRFIEYTSIAGGDEVAMERRGENFFEAARRDTMTRIYEEDRESFLAGFSKEMIVRALDAQGVYTTSYRLVDTGTPVYASMKVTRMLPHRNRIIMGISIIEAQLKQKEAEERAHQQHAVFGRIAALFGKQYALYTVNPETGRYSEYNVTAGYGELGFDKKGENFFTKGRSDGEKLVYPADLPYFRERFTKEEIMRDIREKGRFQMNYRLVINGEPKPIVLRAAMVEESDGEKLTVGVNVEEDGF